MRAANSASACLESALPGRWLAFGVLTALAAVGGCEAGAGAKTGDPSASSVGRLVRLVDRYRIDHRGKAPRSELELRRFAAAMNPADRKALGVASLDDCLISDRDGQPLGLMLGQDEAASADQAVICYERHGKDGMRLVGKVGGDVEVADEVRFHELVPALDTQRKSP